jgi:molecular chaperone DnaK
LKAEIEAAVAETKTAIEGGDPEAMKEKANALAQVAMKMGQAIYEKEQAAGGASSEAPADEAPADDNVVDAEFSEVDEDKKD